MANPILEATRIQARVLIPVVKALEREIGKARAHEIVGRAIAESYVAWREKRGFEADLHPGRAEEAGEAPDFPVERRREIALPAIGFRVSRRRRRVRPDEGHAQDRRRQHRRRMDC
ncbi:MAG: hypothetical protein RIM80_24140 [Alphaproteobacteria bacterium]